MIRKESNIDSLDRDYAHFAPGSGRVGFVLLHIVLKWGKFTAVTPYVDAPSARPPDASLHTWIYFYSRFYQKIYVIHYEDRRAPFGAAKVCASVPDTHCRCMCRTYRRRQREIQTERHSNRLIPSISIPWIQIASHGYRSMPGDMAENDYRPILLCFKSYTICVHRWSNARIMAEALQYVYRICARCFVLIANRFIYVLVPIYIFGIGLRVRLFARAAPIISVSGAQNMRMLFGCRAQQVHCWRGI